MEANGIRYTLLSYTLSTNGLTSPNDYYVSIYSDEQAKADIEKVKDSVDVIIVAMHWGDEYKFVPNAEQIRIAEFLSSLGVNIIIGTHPHVIEPVTYIGDTLVFYSLGNFISSQSTENDYGRLIGLLANVDIIKTVTSDETRITLENVNTELIYTYYKNHSGYKVIPFSKLDDSLLNNYKNYKTKYEAIVKYYDSSINTR
jgi:poly-gamma-glutamate synthesis protein (capsule biosynthesis protein)